MISDHEDPILDACLGEVLASRTPPDVTPRVLQELRSVVLPEPPPVQPLGHDVFTVVTVGQSNAVFPSNTAIPSNTAVPKITVNPEREKKPAALPASPQKYNWSVALLVALAASVIGVGLTIGLASLLRSKPAAVAQRQPATPVPQPNASAPATPDAPRLAAKTPVNDRTENPSQPPAETNLPPPTQLATNSPPSEAPSAIMPTELPPVPRAPRTAAPREQIISFVNAELARSWTSAGVKASPAISDDEWCARVFQRTLGRGPTAAELRQFQGDEASSRRDLLLDRVLSDQYHNLYARHWAKVLASELLGSTVTRPDSLASREDLEKYLTVSLRTNKPFTRIVNELLTAKGAAQPGPGHDPAVNFLLDGWEPTGLIATSRVARVFLGQRLECAQCHDHPTEGWTQEQYWSFNAFFRQMRAEKTETVTRLTNVTFPGQGRSSRDGEVFYETPDGLAKTAFPKFLDGTQIATSGQLSEVDRRRELARLITQSDYLPRAIVNHVWAHYFDYGLLPSLHDLDTAKSSVHAELLDRLANEFAASEFDLKGLIRWTIMSDAFVRSSKLTDLVTSDMPEAGDPPLFSRYYSRPVTGAEVLTSLAQAQRIRRTSGTTAERDKARIDWLAQYNRSSAKDSAKAAAKSSAILAETSTIRVTAGLQSSGIVTKIVAHSMTYDQKVEHLFLAAIGRRPTPRETRTAATVLTTGGDNHATALEDIWWSLLNSHECILDR
jgi:hypothetical protein